jgi:predicted transcriptional regulator
VSEEKPVVSVRLTPKSIRCLDALAQRNGMTKTDVINRALQIYDYIDAEQAEGRQILCRDEAKGEAYVLRWF